MGCRASVSTANDQVSIYSDAMLRCTAAAERSEANIARLESSLTAAEAAFSVEVAGFLHSLHVIRGPFYDAVASMRRARAKRLEDALDVMDACEKQLLASARLALCPIDLDLLDVFETISGSSRLETELPPVSVLVDALNLADLHIPKLLKVNTLIRTAPSPFRSTVTAPYAYEDGPSPHNTLLVQCVDEWGNPILGVQGADLDVCIVSLLRPHPAVGSVISTSETTDTISVRFLVDFSLPRQPLSTFASSRSVSVSVSLGGTHLTTKNIIILPSPTSREIEEALRRCSYVKEVMDPGNRIIGGRGAIDSFLSYTLPALSSYTVAMAFLSVVLFLTEKHEGTPFDRSKRSLGWLKRSITSTDTMMQRVVLLLTIFPSNVTVQRFACSSVTSLLLADAIGWSRVLSAFVGSDGFALVLRGMSAHPESIELQLAGSDVIVTCCYLDSNVGARIVSLGGLDVLYAALLSHQSLCEKLAAGFASLIPSADVMTFLLSKTMGGDAEDIIRRAMIDTVTSYIGFRVTRDHKNRVKSTTHFSIRPLIHQLLGVASKYTTHQGMCLSLLQTVFMDVNPVTQHPADLVEKANSLIDGGGLKVLMMVMRAHQDSPKVLLSCLLTMSMIVRAEDEIKGGSPGITLTPALLNAGVMTVWMGLLRSYAEHEDIVMEACLCISLLLFHCDSASTQQYVREGVITLMCAAMRRFNQSVRLATLCTSTFRNVWVSVGEGKKDFRAMFDDMLSNGCLTVSLFAMTSFPVHEHPAFQLRGCMAVAAISKLYGSTVIAAGGLQAVYDIMDVIDPLENLRLCETTFIALESMALSDLSVGRCADRIIATGGLQRVHRISRELPVATETLTANGYACCALAAIGVRAQGAGIDIVEMGVIRFIAEMLTDLRFRLDDDVDVMFDESYLPDEFESVCGAVCTLMLRSQSFTPFTAGFSFVGPIVSALAGHANHPILSECCSSALMHMCVHAEYRDVIGSNPAAIPALVKAHDTNGCSLATLVHLSTPIYRAAIIATHSYRADTAVKIGDEMQQHPYTVMSTCHPHPLRATILSRKTCDVCICGLDGWWYRCFDCDFNIHPQCCPPAPSPTPTGSA